MYTRERMSERERQREREKKDRKIETYSEVLPTPDV